MVPVPFQHHARKPGFFNNKLALNLEEKVSKKEVDKWWKSISIPWAFACLLLGMGSWKGE